jgi:serine/threonine-protein kinase
MTAALKSGDLVAGRFKILGELGRGAMGVVYKAHDASLDREVALKTIRFDLVGDQSEAGEFRARFLREARTAARLAHPNIVTIFDVGEWEGVSYMAIEYLKGVSLQELLRPKAPLAVADALRIASQTCRGLEEAHTHGVVHRDIKPANIMLVKNNQVKITDFGIAKAESSATLTKDGALVGTPSYMSPEQLSGRALDGRSDIFATGAVLYEMLTGERAFGGANITTVILKVVNQQPEPVRHRNPNLPPGIEAVIDRALQKDPALRYQTMGEMASDLERLMGGSTDATVVAAAPPPRPAPAAAERPQAAAPAPPATSHPPAPARGGGKGLLIGAAGAAVIAVGAAVGFLLLRRAPAPAPAPTPAPITAPAIPPGPSVAVLPFEGKGASAAQGWLPAGLATLFEADLGQSPKIRLVPQDQVAAAASSLGISLGHRLSSDSVRRLGEALRVRTILTGTYDVTGNTIRFDVYLHEAESGKILVTDYDKAEGEARLPAGVDTLSIRVRDALGALPDAGAGDPDRDVGQVLTSNLEALKAFVQGRTALAARDFTTAIESFKKATEKDPTFAAAHARLSETYASMGKGELERQARQEAEARAQAKAAEDTKAAERLKAQETARLEEMRRRADQRQAEEARLRQRAEQEAREISEAERRRAPPPAEPAREAAQAQANPPATAPVAHAPLAEPPAGAAPARAAAREGDLVEPGDLTAPPRVLQKADLRISSQQLRRGVRHGVIILSALIGPRGRVEDVKVLRSDAADYNEAARDSVKRWTFTPPEKDGVKVRTWLTVEIRF